MELELTKLHQKTLLLKWKLLKIKTEKRNHLRRGLYEKAAEIREIEKKVQRQLLALKTQLENRFNELEDMLSNYREKLKIKNILLEFKTIDSEYKLKVCNQIYEQYIKLNLDIDDLIKEKKNEEANVLMKLSNEIGGFLSMFSNKIKLKKFDF
jgi:hypothetical protein